MGFGIGKLFGGLGRSLIGGLIGGRGAGRGGVMPSSQIHQLERFTPAQKAAMAKLVTRGMSDTDVEGLEKKYRHLFERDTVPGLAERFTAMGGGQRSSAFEESLRRGGLELSEQLADLRHSGGMQSLGLGLQPSYQYMATHTPGMHGGGDVGGGGMIGNIMGGLGQMIAGGLGRKMGLGGRRGGGYDMGPGMMGSRQPIRGYGRAPMGAYMPGQPQGLRRGVSPVLLKILEGIEF
jgi:hypothetical protein